MSKQGEMRSVSWTGVHAVLVSWEQRLEGIIGVFADRERISEVTAARIEILEALLEQVQDAIDALEEAEE